MKGLKFARPLQKEFGFKCKQPSGHLYPGHGICLTYIITMYTGHILLASLLSCLVEASWIVPGARWYDTDGNIVNADAGGITIGEETGKFWWFGEYKTEEMEEGGGVSVYSSDDLVTWEHHGLALSMRPPPVVEVDPWKRAS